MPKHRKVIQVETTRTVYCFIRQYWHNEGLSPTHREIAEGCYVATGTVIRHLDRLELMGYIERAEGRKRNIRLTNVIWDVCHDDWSAEAEVAAS